jgi:hypothetical protein
MSSVCAFTPAKRVALATIAEERPEVVDLLRERLAPVLDDLAWTSQGRIVTEAAADAFLLQLRDEFVGRMMIEMPPRGEEEDLRETATEFVARHLLAEARGGLVLRVLEAKRN